MIIRRLLAVLCAALVISGVAKAAIDGIETRFQAQQVNIGQLAVGMRPFTTVSNAATCNHGACLITTEPLTTTAGSTQAITISNSRVVAGDMAICQADANGSTGEPVITSCRVTDGQIVASLRNVAAAAAFNGAIKIYVMILKAGNLN